MGVHLPQLGRAASPALVQEIAAMAEVAGFSDVWASDHVAVPVSTGMPAFFPEPVPLLSLAAGVTTRIGLGTSVLIPAYRNPMHLAKQWATLDWLAPGRTILGVGAGWLREEFGACGVPMQGRAERLDDYIRGWRTLWAGGSEFTSRHFSFAGVRLSPQPGTVRVWIGGSSPGALRRAAWCDGWHPTWSPPGVFAGRLRALRAEMERLGRAPDAVTVSMHAEVRVGEAGDARTGYWSRAGDGYGGRTVLTGSPGDVMAALEAYDGLDHALLTPLAYSAADWREQVAGLAEVVAACAARG